LESNPFIHLALLGGFQLSEWLDEQRMLIKPRHSGTVNFPAALTAPAALDFHDRIGTANKSARVRYLETGGSVPFVACAASRS
jgi:hypothetical protein